MAASTKTVEISLHTARVAHLALLHMERGVRDWANMPDEEGAREKLRSLQEACHELKTAIQAHP